MSVAKLFFYPSINIFICCFRKVRFNLFSWIIDQTTKCSFGIQMTIKILIKTSLGNTCSFYNCIYTCIFIGACWKLINCNTKNIISFFFWQIKKRLWFRSVNSIIGQGLYVNSSPDRGWHGKYSECIIKELNQKW